MIEFLNNFHFLRPWCLLFLLIPFVLYLKKINIRNSVSSWEDICDKNLFKFLSVNNGKSKKKNLKKYIYIALLFSSIAAAGPSWKKIEIPSFTIENPNFFILSMTNDMSRNDIKPTRLDRAKYLMSDIVDEVKQGQFGLEVYSDEPFVISPITDDANLIKNLLLQVNLDIMPSSGDRLDRAIDLAINKFKDAKYSNGNIILFASDVGQRFDLALKHVEKAKKLNYVINVIDTSYNGNEKLKILAEKGDGVYLKIRENNIMPLVNKLNDINTEKAKLSQNLRSNYEDFGYYLLIIPLISVLMFFRKGFFVILLLFSFNAEAGFWKNNNQEGYNLFKQENFDEASKKFEDHLWKSIALYKLENFEEALKELENEDNEIALYNKGVILAKLCKYEEAKNTFIDVIKINPNNEDAKHNLAVIDDLFTKAKENPSVLECNNQQQNNKQNQSNNQENNKDKQEQQSSSDNNKEQSSNSQDENKKQNKEQENSEQNNKNEQQKEKQESSELDENTNKENSKPKEDNQNSQESDNKEKQDNENKENSKENSDKESKENQNKNNSNDEADSDKTEGQSKENNNNNNEQNKENSEQEGQQDVSVVNAKEGSKDDEYDEEALIMQRRYRDIPEDVGGLLREFIKKEYIKDRYKNEIN